MFRERTGWGARLLLMAAMAMLIETSCSHAPPPPTTPEMKAAIDDFAGKDVVLRVHTTDGTTYATSRYAVTDSFIVVMKILRDTKYYQPTSAKLYGKADLRPPAKDVTLPVRIPIGQVKAVEKWEPRSVKADVVGGGLMVVGVFAVAVALALYFLGRALRYP